MTKLFEAKPFIVCEIGSNWTSLSDARYSIRMAKAAGADAVKFQLFDGESLFGFPSIDVDKIPHMFSPEAVHKVEAHRLPAIWLPELKAEADRNGIEFMCTAFSPELVAVVDPYVSVHKIASSCLSYPQLLEAVAKTGKPVLLSTGASAKGDIAFALKVLEEAKSGEVVLLYCNAAYPSTRHNLFLMDELKQFGRKVGLSDHSLDAIYAPLSAVKHFGAVVIEKHFTAIEAKTPDSGHSLNVDGFKCMVDYIRGKRDGGLNPTSEEKDMFLRHNVRLIATKDIKPGDIMEYGKNYGTFRSLEDDNKGLSGFAWNHPDLIGRPATKALACGKGVSLDVVK